MLVSITPAAFLYILVKRGTKLTLICQYVVTLTLLNLASLPTTAAGNCLTSDTNIPNLPMLELPTSVVCSARPASSLLHHCGGNCVGLKYTDWRIPKSVVVQKCQLWGGKTAGWTRALGSVGCSVGPVPVTVSWDALEVTSRGRCR